MNRILTLLSRPTLEGFYARGDWRTETIYSLVRSHADRAPGRVAIKEMGRSLTYAELVASANGLAERWRREGVRLGDRVAVWLPSRLETAIILLACSREGFVCSPSIHASHTVGEVADLVRRMRATVLVAQRGYGADAGTVDVRAACAGIEGVKVITLLDAVDDTLLAGLAEANGTAGAPVHQDPDAPAYLAFTSGTTGQPKGVIHTDNTLLSPARALARDWHLADDLVVYSMSPLSHNLGFGAMLLALSVGGQLVVHDLPRGASLMDRIVETGTTFLFGVPTHAIDLLAELSARGADRLGGVKGFRVSGAPIPPVVARGLLDHGVTPQSGFGMTEAGSHQYTLPDDDTDLIVNSVGHSYDGYEVAIFASDDPDRVLAPTEIGQIGGRGASLMLGYFGDQAATESSFNTDGWFLTGDIGWLDEHGYLHITGRKKDVIIRGGHNIYPARIENLALQNDDIALAAAIPVVDDRLGERVCLVVQAKDGRPIDASETLKGLAGAGLSKYDLPEYFAQIDVMPLGPTGKVAKQRVLAMVASGELEPTALRD